MFDSDPLKAKEREALLTAALDILDSDPPPQTVSQPVPVHLTSPSKNAKDIILVNDTPSKAMLKKKQKDDSDPIESANEFDKHKTPPRQASARAESQSPRKPGTAKRMKTRSGILPSADSETPLPVLNLDDLDFLPTSTPLPDTDVPVQSSTAHRASSVDVMPPPPPVSEPKAPARRGRRPLSEEEKAAREKAKADEKARKAEERAQKAAAKQAEKEAKAKQRAESALAKKGASKASTKTPSGTPSTSQHAEPTTPLTSSQKASQPPQSTTQWAIIDGISPKSNDTTSQLVDELNSSSRSSSANAPIQEPGDEQAPVRPGSKPLFLPSDSQSQFPYSQWNVDTTPAQRAQDDNSPTESESEEDSTLRPKPTPRLTSSTAPKYRRLTDIASQEIFSPSAMSPLNYFPSTPAVNDKSKITRSNGDDEEDDDSEDDSEDDSDADTKSHIPKSRRAGRVLRSRKKSGLFSFA